MGYIYYSLFSYAWKGDKMICIGKCKMCGCEFEYDKKTRTKNYCSHKCRDIAYRTRNNLNTYGRYKPLVKQCEVCGKTFETFRDPVVTCSHECSQIRKHNLDKGRRRDGHGRKSKTGLSLEEYNLKRKQQAQERSDVKRIERIWYDAIHTEARICEWCGDTFYCKDNDKRKTCSLECSRKRSNAQRDKRIPKEQIVDKDITLPRLYRRDKGVCYICGCICDLNDWKTTIGGQKYPGDNRPEIEHVVPISRGGLHSWDNVRLACHKCNSEKADGIIKIEPMSHEFAISERWQDQAKKTAQYTLDGELVRIWKSTGEIERELGLNSKRIQSVCRHDKSRTGNAFGFHWEYVEA